MITYQDSAKTKRVPRRCGSHPQTPGRRCRGRQRRPWNRRTQNTGRAASRALLNEITGIPHARWAGAGWTSTADNYNHVCTTADAAWASYGGNVKTGQYAQAKVYDYDSQDGAGNSSPPTAAASTSI